MPGSVSGTLAGPNAIGTFDNAADIGLTNGVLLTTGTFLTQLDPITLDLRQGPGLYPVSVLLSVLFRQASLGGMYSLLNMKNGWAPNSMIDSVLH